jgi:hypothetical protein
MSGFSKLLAGKHFPTCPYRDYDFTIRIIEEYERCLTPASSPAFETRFDYCGCCYHEHDEYGDAAEPVTTALQPTTEHKPEPGGKEPVTARGNLTEDEVIAQIDQVRSPCTLHNILKRY